MAVIPILCLGFQAAAMWGSFCQQTQKQQRVIGKCSYAGVHSVLIGPLGLQVSFH